MQSTFSWCKRAYTGTRGRVNRTPSICLGKDREMNAHSCCKNKTHTMRLGKVGCAWIHKWQWVKHTTKTKKNKFTEPSGKWWLKILPVWLPLLRQCLGFSGSVQISYPSEGPKTQLVVLLARCGCVLPTAPLVWNSHATVLIRECLAAVLIINAIQVCWVTKRCPLPAWCCSDWGCSCPGCWNWVSSLWCSEQSCPWN